MTKKVTEETLIYPKKARSLRVVAIENIRRLGLIETGFLFVSYAFLKFSSVMKVLILNLRGYDVFSSVFIGRNFMAAQKYRRSISIGGGTLIGNNVHLECVGKGRINLGKNVGINDFARIYAGSRVTIGDRTVIAPFCFIIDMDHLFEGLRPTLYQPNAASEVRIGKDVWLGKGVTVLRGVKIGDNCVVGADSVVTKDLPRNSISVGVPAKVIGQRRK